ncbi:MAG TPA: carboxypeptidase-like regulatory domain-containing protein [Planctomycetota bacterium]|nr:carboxypeptidase-like regulatory domain-containing protein [Planctomycetota bacterium]
MRRRSISLGLLVALLAGVVAWLAGADLSVLGLPASAPDHGADVAPPEAAHATDLSAAAAEEAGRLQGFPGLALARRGTGTIVGTVSLHVPGEGVRPLPGVVVEARARHDGREISSDAETDADGRFTLAPVTAVPGWVLVARHPPHAEIVVRGLSVHEGLATDAGALVFGAATTLEGIVVDEAGRPVPGARILVERDRTRDGAADLLKTLRELALGSGPLAEGRSEGDGTFAVAGLPPGRYLVRVTHGGHATAFLRGITVTVDGDAARVRVVLDAGAGFEGRVAEDGGRPIAGATVVALAIRTERADAMDRHETRSDGDGRYRLDTLAAGTTYFVEAYRAGFAPSGQLRPGVRGVQPLDFALVPGGRIEGRIVDKKSRAPVPTAEVLAITGFVGRGVAPVSTVADEGGRYVLENVTPGPLVLLEVRAPGYGPVGIGYDAKAPRMVEPGATLVVDVEASTGGVVTGTVRGDDGRPLPWVSVAATRPNDRFGGEVATLTDASGAYRLLGLRWGGHVLAVTAPGWAAPVEESEVQVDVSEAKPEVVRDFTLRAGATVEGRITTPDGQPAVGARVAVVPRDLRQYGSRVRDLVAVADRRGAYRVQGVPPALDLVLEASGESGVKSASPPFQARPGAVQTVNLVLRAGARIVGRVTDVAGRAVGGALVRFGHVEPEDVGRLGDSYRAEEFLAPRTFRADGDGRFTCDDVPPGRTILKVEAEGFAPWFRRDLTVPEDGDLLGLAVALEGARSVKGRVFAADTGRPIPGVWVYARVRDAEDAPKDDGLVRNTASAETGADGAYVLERLPPGPVEVAVWLALGYRNSWEDPQNAKRESVPAGSTGIDFRLVPQGAPVEGK